MESIRINYSQRDNLGDAINPFIIERVMGCRPVHADPYHCQFSGIGSGLGRFLYDPAQFRLRGQLRRAVQRQLFREPVVLWSSGFIETPTGNEKKLRANTVPAAVRGKRSLEYVRKLLNTQAADCVTGDAGLLAAELLDRPVEKKYSLGIIPHDKERGEPAYRQLRERWPDAVLIDIRGDVMQRLELIASCECIISSSLHGLIIADGFHIPNRQVVLTDRLAGDGFKFADYYSAYDLTPDPIDLRQEAFLGPESVFAGYRVQADAVELKKTQLVRAFRRHI